MKLILTDCCGVVSLRTTCFIIAYFNLVIKLLISIFLLVTIIASALIPNERSGSRGTTAELVGVLVAVTCSVWLFFVLIDFIFIIVLLVGLHKSKRLHIKVFLIYSLVFWSLSIIMFFIHIEQINAPVICAILAVCLTKIYSLLVIRSYYMKLCEIKENNPPSII